jgi:hypothetical protein
LKSYQQKDGKCSECTLLFYCKKDEFNMAKFLRKIGIVCVDGKCLEVVDDDKTATNKNN